jgi:hypothetical protein
MPRAGRSQQRRALQTLCAIDASIAALSNARGMGANSARRRAEEGKRSRIAMDAQLAQPRRQKPAQLQRARKKSNRMHFGGYLAIAILRVASGIFSGASDVAGPTSRRP